MKTCDYIEKTKICKEPIVEYLYCDACNKLIYKRRIGERNGWTGNTVSWYRVTTGHYDWGNDSCDSVENNDICAECLPTLLDAFTKETNGKQNTKYINIEHRYLHIDISKN